MIDDNLSKKLYNPEHKKLFLNQYDNENTKSTLENILAKAKTTEEVLNKDLYDFTLDEIGQVIKAANPLNQTSAYGIGRHIYRYILFSKNLRKSNLHPLDGIDPKWYGNWVDHKKYLFSKTEIEDIVALQDNAQDRAMLALLFEGAHGKENSELRNLRKQDVDEFYSEIKLHDDKDKSVRVIAISEWCMNAIQQAIESTGYKRSTRSGKEIQAPVSDNDYVFRPIYFENRINEKAPISPYAINTRVRRIADGLDLPYFRTKGIQQSGMIYMAYRLLKRDHKLDNEELVEISKKYNVGNYIYGVGDKPYLNTSLFKNIVNMDIIKRLYDLDD